MRKIWLHRLLLSYLPVFILFVCLFMFIGIIQLNSLSRQDAVKSSRAFAENLQNNLDMSLRSIEMMMIGTITRNSTLTSFAGMESSPEFIIDLSQLLQSMVSTNSLIDSIYVYRAGDGTIVSDQTKLSVDQFADRAYAEAGLNAQSSVWSDPRTFRVFAGGERKETVVSMTQSIPLGSRGIAILVVNVSMGGIRDYFDSFGQSGVSELSVADRNGEAVFGQSAALTGKAPVSLTSAYSGLTYRSELKTSVSGNLYEYITSGWVMFGLLGLLIGIWWVVYISRRNYKPIESILSRIQTYNEQHRNSFLREPIGDELRYIDYTLSNMIEATQDYEHRDREHARLRRLRLFRELLEGGGTVGEAEWSEAMSGLGGGGTFAGAAVSLIEIDQYSAFIGGYSHEDQGLFKYILTKVVEETARTHSLRIWQEWATNHRLCVIVLSESEEERVQASRRILAHAEEVREWLQNHLKLTITWGIGSSVTEVGDISKSCESAVRALDYKSALGSNRVIGHWEIEDLASGDLFVYLQYVRTIAQAFRVGSEDWKEQLGLLFAGLRSLLLPREEIDGVLIYMNYFFLREMTELPPEYQEIWNREFRERWEERMDSLETLDELEAFYSDRLTACFSRMKSLREERGNHAAVRRVREYIERNFHNPDLSLTLLGEKFQMNTSSLSTLFKEEFGEKFVAYLCQVRMEHAKDMLRNGSLPINEIAGRVGYQHPMSFIRTFKKMVGVTPGDYRKVHQP
ncbi:helix-turn-helix domain-containing protein [Cohnella fermenti]|uniref:Helix-turn-helix transcriptional regulator n=1 Tax=Cohnella fermenti TaxID=2565925 RepID=A0A4S4BFD0_9BACL|nr:helix-turn-helix domain-containing protein [Cohnella fermenti]THF73002.1 helix-turn-helix transcriptional regulator [Cohnella fermenti]